jgi:hypothetical protein
VLDESISTTHVLREAYVVGREIKQPAFVQWVERELNGYELGEPKPGEEPPAGFPGYRRPGGRLMGEAAMGIRKPIMFENAEVYDKLTRPPLPHPIIELEELSKQPYVWMELTPGNASQIQRVIGNVRPYVEYPAVAFRSMISSIRHELLQRVLDLQELLPDLEPGVARENADELLRAEQELRRGPSPGDRINAFLNANTWTTRLIAEILKAYSGVSP